MSRSDIARQRLKEIRTLQGFEAAYKAAGLPDDGAKRNTQMKRLSRLINRRTGGFKDLSSAQRRKINRTYRTPTRQRALSEAKADQFIKKENKVRLQARREIRATFGEGGTNPNPDRLRRRLAQYAPLKAEDRERFLQAQRNIENDSGRSFRREYARSTARVGLRDLPANVRESERRRRSKADRAVWRDSGEQITFDEWSRKSFEEKYGA